MKTFWKQCMSGWRGLWLLCSGLWAQRVDTLLIYHGVLGKDERFHLQRPSVSQVDSLRRLAYQGSLQAQMALVEYFQLIELRPDSARRYLQMALAAGSVEAAYLLGVAYLRGVEAPRRPAEARRLLDTAAKKGYVLALRVLWQELEVPDSIEVLRRRVWPPDPEAAFEYAEAAACRGDCPSMVALARYYAKGQGTPKNDSLAYHWLEKAASQSYILAQVLLAEWCLERWLMPDQAIGWADLVLQNENASMEERYRASIVRYYAEVLPRWLSQFREGLGLAPKAYERPSWYHASSRP